MNRSVTQTAGIPKVSLGIYPTPLQELTNLGRSLGSGKRLFLKREDLCGVGFGGNKVRKMEYILAEAIAQGCDCVVTAGGAKSNQTIATAACAAKLNLPTYLVVPESTKSVTRRLGEFLHVSFHFAPSGKTADLTKGIRTVAAELREEGRRPYVIAPGAAVPLGIVAYADAMYEIFEQAKGLGIHIDHVVCCGGTGNTYGGVVLGAKLYNPSTKTTAVSIGRRFTHKHTLCSRVKEAAALLGRDVQVTEDDMNVHFSCGKGAEEPTVKGGESMERMAALEGVFLDPIFSGKAFAGLLELNEMGAFGSGENIVFIHTGGTISPLDGIQK